jgi:2,4-dienoyl-CoA reductase-like NADH-dependent reductase (Old Yellow Enzyme family)
MITGYEQAEAILGTGDADLIALARAALYDPRWPWRAAAYFGAQVRLRTSISARNPASSPTCSRSRWRTSRSNTARSIALG